MHVHMVLIVQCSEWCTAEEMMQQTNSCLQRQKRSTQTDSKAHLGVHTAQALQHHISQLDVQSERQMHGVASPPALPSTTPEVRYTLEGILHRVCSRAAAPACCRAKPLEVAAGSCLRAARCALWLGPTAVTCSAKLLKLSAQSWS